MEWSKKTTLDLIELLHAQESLWNVKHETYKDRQKKKDALAVIASQIGIDVGDVDKKITNLKNQYNRELIKMKTKSGYGIDDVYVSPWYGFKPLGFLRNNNLPKSTRSCDNIISEDQNDSIESNLLIAPFIENHDVPCVLGALDVSSITEKKGLKRVKPSEHKEALSVLKDAHDSIIKHPARDEFDVFGEYVAFELRGVIDKRNILELKKQIQDLIYTTKLNEINYESKKVFEQTLTATGDGRSNNGIYTQPETCTDDLTWIKNEP